MTTGYLSFQDTVALITGGGTGMGRATALAFAKRGACVVVSDMTEYGAQTVRMISQTGGRALFVQTDVSQVDNVQALINTAVNTFGGLHHAFNNAAYLLPMVPASRDDTVIHARIMTAAVRGTALCMQYQAQYMASAGAGNIVNTTSLPTAFAGVDMAPYIEARQAIVTMTKACAGENGPHGVRVNALARSRVDLSNIRRGAADQDIFRTVLSSPLIDLPENSQELATTVLYLCSPVSSFANGQVFTINH